MSVRNHQNGEEYQRIFENAIEGIFQSSLEGRFVKVNPAMAQIYGYDSPEDMIASVKSIEEQIYANAEDRQRFLQKLQSNDQVKKFESENYRKDGSIIWTQTSARIVRDSVGKPLYIEGFLADITSRKKAELALRESEERYRTLVERLPGAVFLEALKDSEHSTYVNSKIEDLLGYPAQEWVESVEWSQIIHPTDRERVQAANQASDKDGTPFRQEYRIRHKDGRYVWVREETYLIKDKHGKPLYWQGFLFDISEQKQAEAAIQESEVQFRKIFQANPIASCIAKLEDGCFIAANDAYWELSGFVPENFLGHTSIELGFVDEKNRQNIVTRLKQEKSIHNENGKLITSDGNIRDTLEFFELITFDGQDCILAMFYDITEKTNAQKALQESEMRFRLAFQTSPDAININRLEDGLYVDINEGFTNITGYTREDVIGKTSAEVNIWADKRDRERLVEGLRNKGFVDNLEAKFRIKSGETVTGLMSASVITLGGVPHIISISREIETIKRTENTLQRQLKELTILHNVAVASSSSLNLDELLQHVTNTILDTLHPDNCGIELVIESGKAYQAHSSYRGELSTDFGKPVPLHRGITGKVIRTGKPVRLGDVAQDSDYIEITKGVLSELCVPIKIQDKTIGAINIESKKNDAYDVSDERLLNTIAGSLSTAIEKLNLLEAEVVRRQRTETLLDATNALTSFLDVDTLLESILEQLAQIVPYDSASIAMENENGELIIVAGKGFPPGYEVIGKEIGHSEKWLLLNAKRYAYIIPDVQQESTFEQWEGSEYIRGWMGVPMYVHDKLMGFINLDSRTVNAFSDQDAVLAQTFANSAAVAIENARLFELEQKSREKAETLREATAALTTSIDLEELYETTLNSLEKLIPFDSASIEIVDQGYLEIVAGRGLRENKVCLGTRYPYVADKWGDLNSLRGAIIIPDVQKDARFEKLTGTEYIHGWMGVPMVLHDQIIGFLNFDSTVKGFFTDEHASLAQTFGNQAAVAIENARLFAQEQEQRERNAVLLDLMRIASSSLDLDAVMQTILERLIAIVPASSGTIQMLDGQELLVTAAIGFEKNVLPKGQLLKVSDSPIKQQALKSKEPVYIVDTTKEKAFLIFPGAENIRSFLCIPLVYKNRSVGVITLDGVKESHFTTADIELAAAVAKNATIAIENARLFEAEHRRHREAETLRQAALAITTSLELESVLETILFVMKQVLPYDSASVILLEQDKLKVTAAQGFDEKENITNLHFPASDELFLAVKNNEEPIILPNAQKDARFKRYGNTKHTRGWMGVPLILRGEVIGYLSFDSHKESMYNQSHAILAQSFANQAASAIQNARQFEVEQRHFQEADTLRKAAEAVSSSLDIQQVLDSILENLNLVVPFDSASVFLIENEKIRLTAMKGLPERAGSIDQTFPLSNPLMQEILQTHHSLILEDASKEPRFENWGKSEVHGWMGVPLITHGNVIGYITLDNEKTGAYDEHNANLAMTFAHQAAVAIENARLYRRGEQQIRQLTVLRDIDNAISSSFNLRVTLNLLLNHAINELNAKAATILLYNPSLHSLSLFTGTGVTEKRTPLSSPIRVGEGLAGRVALQRKLVHISDISKEEIPPHSMPYNQQGNTSYFGIPLIGKGQIKGVLEIYTSEKFYPSADWINFLHTLAGQAAIAIDNAQMFRNLQRSNQELTLAYDTTLAGWGRALELRDKETQGHTSRVVEMTIELSRRMGIEGEDLTHVMRGTLLHDIGKMGVPDSILHKPGKLTVEEWDVMKQHPQYAYDLMSPIPFLRPAMDIPYSHHEHWNGNGYPQGLKGEDIPLAARIFAVVDVWDALLYERPYREAWPEHRVIEQLKLESGTKLDPKVVEKFLEMIKEDAYRPKQAG